MMHKFMIKPSRLLSAEQYKAYIQLYLILMRNMDNFWRGEIEFQSISTLLRVSSQLIKDKNVDLPYTADEIRHQFAKNIKTSLSS